MRPALGSPSLRSRLSVPLTRPRILEQIMPPAPQFPCPCKGAAVTSSRGKLTPSCKGSTAAILEGVERLEGSPLGSGELVPFRA